MTPVVAPPVDPPVAVVAPLVTYDQFSMLFEQHADQLYWMENKADVKPIFDAHPQHHGIVTLMAENTSKSYYRGDNDIAIDISEEDRADVMLKIVQCMSMGEFRGYYSSLNMVASTDAATKMAGQKWLKYHVDSGGWPDPEVEVASSLPSNSGASGATGLSFSLFLSLDLNLSLLCIECYCDIILNIKTLRYSSQFLAFWSYWSYWSLSFSLSLSLNHVLNTGMHR